MFENTLVAGNGSDGGHKAFEAAPHDQRHRKATAPRQEEVCSPWRFQAVGILQSIVRWDFARSGPRRPLQRFARQIRARGVLRTEGIFDHLSAISGTTQRRKACVIIR